jgi:hypothetical protein
MNVLTKNEPIGYWTVQYFEFVYIVFGSVIQVNELSGHFQLLCGLAGTFGTQK